MEQQTFKNTLIGVFETFIMMPSAIDRFSANRIAALKSFFYPLMQYPFILWAFAKANHVTDPFVLVLHILVSWLGLFIFYGIIFAIARSMQKREYFWQFVNMANSYYLLGTVLLLPIFACLYTGHADTAFYHQYWVFFIVADMAFTAFIVAKSLRLNWMIGGFMASANLFLSDTGTQMILLYLHYSHEVVASAKSVMLSFLG